MGSIKTNSVRKARKATFTVTTVKGKRQFRAVNKRAKFVARKAGKKVNLTLSELKSLNGTGTYRYYAYVNGSLKPIRF